MVDVVTRALVGQEALEAAKAGGRRHTRKDLTAAIYGSLLVTSLLAAQARHDASPDFVALTLLIGVAVFWLMEVWTGLVALRVEGSITRREASVVARTEIPMLTAAVVPMAILFLGGFAVIDTDTALNVALAFCVAQLFVWGLAVGRALQKGWVVTLVVAAVDCLFGLLIVFLKVLVIH